jgi:hypothetical protein
VAVERSNPLPPNARYWVDVAPEDQPAFTAWLTVNRQAVKVVSSTRDSDNGWDWILFETTAPLVWWEGPGFPTKATADVHSESDVKDIPHVESSAELLESLGNSVASAASSGTTKLAIGAGAILVAAILLSRVMR